MNDLQRIKDDFEAYKNVGKEDTEWLISEVERLRKKLPIERIIETPPTPPDGWAYCNVCSKMITLIGAIHIPAIGYMCSKPCYPSPDYQSRHGYDIK